MRARSWAGSSYAVLRAAPRFNAASSMPAWRRIGEGREIGWGGGLAGSGRGMIPA